MATDSQLQPQLVPAGLEEFLQLEEKIARLAETLRQAREGRARAEQESAAIKAKFTEARQEFARAEKETISLRRERDEVRRRVEKLLAELDALNAE